MHYGSAMLQADDILRSNNAAVSGLGDEAGINAALSARNAALPRDPRWDQIKAAQRCLKVTATFFQRKRVAYRSTRPALLGELCHLRRET
jgi:hypothetical protein